MIYNQRLEETLLIVVAFDFGERAPSSVILGHPEALVYEFDRDGMEEAFHRGIVASVAVPSHGVHRLPVDELFAMGLGRVLPAAA